MQKENEKMNQSTNNSPEELVRIDRMFESLTYNEYSPENALGELIDNSVQAGAANIDIIVKREKMRRPGRKKASEAITEIAIIDNGCGMNFQVLKKCLVLGESMHPIKNGKAGIGRFGCGMTTGSISVSRIVEVYSRDKDDVQFLFTYLNMDEIKAGIQKVVPLPIQKEPPLEYIGYLSHSSGTIVVLKEYYRNYENLDGLANYIGRTYRKFIEAGLEITLNNEKVYLHDPLYMAGPTKFDIQELQENNVEPKAILLGEEKITLEIPEQEGKTADIIIRMSLLPEVWRLHRGDGGKAETKKRKIEQNEGVSILRANREVLYGWVPYIIGEKGVAASNEIDRWWGCEISFPPELDSYFQVRYIKRGVEPLPEIRNKIREIIQPTVREARKRIQEVWSVQMARESKDLGNFGKAEETMEKIESILPRSRKGQEMTKKEEEKKLDKVVSELSEKVKSQDEYEKKKEEISRKPYSIVPVNYPQNILFDTEYLLGKVIIKLNVNHPFYKKIFQPLCGAWEEHDDESTKINNKKDDVKNAILLLLFSYARAEAMFSKNDDLLMNLKQQWGTMLATAINNYEGENK